MHTASSGRCSFGGVLLSLAMATAASAQPTVNAATYLIATRSNGASATYTSPGTYQTANGRVSISTQPVTLLTSRSTGGAPGFDTGSYAYMSYFFRMLGAPDVLVPATFSARMFASVSIPPLDEETVAFSSFRLFSADGAGRFYDSNGDALSDGPSRSLRLYLQAGTLRFDTPVDFTVDANAQYGVELVVQTQTQTSGEVAEAWIDPVITIDPAFAEDYSLVLSPGVSNLAPDASTTVPEPASLMLVGVGLLGLTGAWRRRRAQH